MNAVAAARPTFALRTAAPAARSAPVAAARPAAVVARRAAAVIARAADEKSSDIDAEAILSARREEKDCLST